MRLCGKDFNELSVSELYTLEDCIEALYEMLPLKEGLDEVWFANRLRHILEILDVHYPY